MGYTPEQRSRAIAALRESTRMIKGRPVPQYEAVSRMPDMPTKATLIKWWRWYMAEKEGTATTERFHIRDPSEEMQARQEAVIQGVQDWHETQLSKVREAISWILSPQHREGEDHIRPDQMARALRDLSSVLEIVAPKQPEEDVSRKAHSSRIHRLRVAAKRVGLSEGEGSK